MPEAATTQELRAVKIVQISLTLHIDPEIEVNCIFIKKFEVRLSTSHLLKLSQSIPLLSFYRKKRKYYSKLLMYNFQQQQKIENWPVIARNFRLIG
jgi:hypothetical protein